ncbi:hypothetical protein F511_09036 [Dorcoceras hygrometricum]|uniref:ENT domain-containing protein n=1 Tax=Dorcoceras hygrometricum TaxID=472368 RepID=A0A2Z7AL10_9LAMI|nr:hypothetical protein F511_09036 [Dorcoceras hygrometricum]
MRFRKGDKVEVMSKKEGPVSWRLAEVLSCKGHSLCLRYDPFPGGEKELMVETVSREFVRPVPPLVQGLENCVSGDIVEVFYQFSWHISAIVKIMVSKRGNTNNKVYRADAVFQNKYLVRIIGSSKELVVDQSNIRLRQTWHQGKWILMVKTSQKCEEKRATKPSTSNCYQKMNFQVPLSNACPTTQKDFVHDNLGVRKSPAFSARSLKRKSPNRDSLAEAHNGHVCKFRAVEKDGQKVDAVAYPREILGKKNMHASFKYISYRSNQAESAKQNYDLGCSRVRISESSTQSEASSVGSCSMTNQTNQKTNMFRHFMPLSCQVTDTLCSDAESCYGLDSVRESCSLHSEEELEVSIHRFELHAYSNTLEALYASGPLSWEREALLTNLRSMLNISNDEHLMELKHLISANTDVHIR